MSLFDPRTYPPGSWAIPKCHGGIPHATVDDGMIAGLTIIPERNGKTGAPRIIAAFRFPPIESD
jgi:hypothetical protein